MRSPEAIISANWGDYPFIQHIAARFVFRLPRIQVWLSPETRQSEAGHRDRRRRPRRVRPIGHVTGNGRVGVTFTRHCL